MARYYDEEDEILERTGGDLLLATFRRKRQEANAKRQEAFELYQAAREAQQAWLESTRDATIGYGMLDSPDEADGTITVYFELPPKSPINDDEAMNAIDDLNSRIAAAVKEWLRERAPKGSRTNLITVEA